MAIDRFSFGVQRVPIGTKESARTRSAGEKEKLGACGQGKESGEGEGAAGRKGKKGREERDAEEKEERMMRAK